MNSRGFVFCWIVLILSAFQLQARTQDYVKDGEATLYVGETLDIYIGDTYQSVYRSSGVKSIVSDWTLDYSDQSKISILYENNNYARIKGLKPITKAKLYYHSSFYWDNYYREYNFYYEITVKEKTISVTRIDVKPSSLSMNVGDISTLTYEVWPTNATNKGVNWYSEDESVALVSEGTVTARKKGYTNIYCAAKDGSGARGICYVSVTNPTVDVTSISLPSMAAVGLDESINLEATILPSNATDKTITWKSSDTSVATVSSGVVKGLKTGTATITATAHNGLSASCKLTVYDPVFVFCPEEDFCITCRVLSYDNKTCQVGEYIDKENTPAIDAYYECDLVIPNSYNGFKVERIGGGAFYECMIRSVEIPASVCQIGEGAFYGCSNLWKMTIKGTSIDVSEDAFEGVGSEDNPCVIDVPDNFNFGTDTSGSIFKWKGGYFVLGENYTPSKRTGYVELSKDLTTLTFYCDNAWEQKDGIVFNLNKDGEDPAWLQFCYYVTNVVFDDSFENARPRTAYRWFYGLSKLTSVCLEESTSLYSLDQFRRITSTQEMFANCTSLQTVDLTAIKNSGSLVSASGMFRNCSQLEEIVFFRHYKPCPCCPDMPELDIDDVSPINISYMFYGCKKLRNLSFFDVFTKGMVSDATSLFEGCESLSGLDLRFTEFSSDVLSERLLVGCTGLKYLLLDASAINLATYAFYNVGQAEEPCGIYAPQGTNFGVNSTTDIFYFKGGRFTMRTPRAYAILNDNHLTFYYDNRMLDHEGSVYLVENGPRWNDKSYHEYSTVVFDESFKDYKPTSISGWFWDQHTLEAFEKLENLNTSEVTNMSYLFGGYHETCLGVTGNIIESLDVSHFDTSKVTSMEGMFQGCAGLISLDVSHFNTSKVTNMSYMFDGCSSLTDIDVSHFNTSNVTSMESMFLGCQSLGKLDVSHFNTSKVDNSCKMFSVSLENERIENFFDEVNPAALKTLVVSPTMADLPDDACLGVGAFNTYNYDPETDEEIIHTHYDTPVEIIAPRGFDFGTDTSGESFMWKGGLFRLANNIAYANSVSIKPGESADLTINLKNGDNEVSKYEFVLLLPEGVELAKNGGDYEYTFSDRYSKEGMRVSIVNPSPGEYRLFVFSLSKVTLTGKDGPIITLSLETNGQLPEGSYTVTLKDFVCYNTEGENLDVTEMDCPIYVTSFSPGDVNHDGSLNVVDVMLVVNSILGTDNEVYHPENSDMDANGFVNVADVTRIVDAIQSQPIKMTPSTAKDTEF